MAAVLNIIRYLARFSVFFVTNCYGLFSYMMWTTLLSPLRILWPAAYWKFESFVFKGLQSFVIIWMGRGDYKVIEAGDDIRKLSEEEAVVMCNHQSTADTPLVMLALWPKGSCMNNSFWIMDWVFRFTNFGLISTMRRDFFIKQGKETRDKQAQQLINHLKGCFMPQGRKWIILFPEGGFLRKRIETSHSYARKNGYPILNNVTLPRIGALKAIFDTIGAPERSPSNEDMTNETPLDESDPERPLKWVVDMTIAYRNSTADPPDMFGMCVGFREKQNMYVHYRAYPLSCIPRDSEGLLKWLYDRYVEKERMMDYFQSHGTFPSDSEDRPQVLSSLSAREVTYDWLSVGLYQAFYIISTYIHYTCVIKPLWSMAFK